MGKNSIQFICSECGYSDTKWSGQCPGCSKWNTLIEEEVQPITYSSITKSKAVFKTYRLNEINEYEHKRFLTEITEFDRVLGGGVVPGGVALCGGEPGIGKSTLLLQAAHKLSKYGDVLYVSGEESAAQIKMRASRLGIKDGIILMAETELKSILSGIEKIQPRFLIIDSIQTLYDSDISSAPGSVSQVKGCTSKITLNAKRMNSSTFIIGHVTKEGAIAGPRILEHLVDTVLYFEGERTSNFRILRAVKNRFGSTDEIGVFEMRDTGMKEVKDPDLLSDETGADGLTGVCIFAGTQGTRPMLLEVQALCAHTQINIPRRLSSGYDLNRLYMICAVLEKKIGLKLYTQDIFLNVAGGIKIKEYAADLALAVSIVSSLRNMPVKKDTAFIGEIGLAGEIRRVNAMQKRLSECAKLGLKRAFIPAHELASANIKGMELIGVNTLFDVLEKAF